MVLRVSQMYIDMIKAFRADCDTLIERFESEENHNLDTFLQLWQTFKFNLVYERKYPRNGIFYDFMADTLQISKLIMLREHFVGGMFLMYGLYSLQDFPTVSIRLDHGEFRHILKMLRLKKEDKKMNDELTWIFSTLLKDDAFEFVAFAREFDMEGQHRAEMIHNSKYDFSDDEDPRAVKPKDWLRRFSQDSQKDMKDLKDFENDYLKRKMRIKAAFPVLNLSLDMVQEDIMNTVMRALTQADSMAEPGDDVSIGARRRLLKNRKMKTKHRLKLDYSDDEAVPCERYPQVKRRRGPKMGRRKLFFSQAINDDMDESSDSEKELDQILADAKLCLPDLY